METTFIYSLIDPITKEIRYIGKANNLKNRLWAHINEARNIKTKSHKNNWIRSLLRKEVKPIINLIEEVSIENWINREIYWIAYFKNEGYDLLNMTQGGECGIISDKCRNALIKYGKRRKKGEYYHTEETKVKIRLKRKNQIITDEQRKKLSERLKGRIITEEHRQKISNALKGIHRPKEQLDRMTELTCKKVKEIDENGNEKIWKSVSEVSRYYNMNRITFTRQMLDNTVKKKLLKSKFYYLNN